MKHNALVKRIIYLTMWLPMCCYAVFKLYDWMAGKSELGFKEYSLLGLILLTLTTLPLMPWKEWQKQEEAKLAAQKSSKVSCPQCSSEQIVANKKGFGIGKAIVGGALLGVAGAVAGFLGSRKLYLTCLSCGHKWNLGKN